MNRHDKYFSKFKFAKGLRPDDGVKASLPDGYKMRWLGRLTFKGQNMYWDDVHVGRIIKKGKSYLAIPLDLIPKMVCPTCQQETSEPLVNVVGFRCINPDNIYQDVWSHGVVWLEVNSYPTRDHAIQSLIPKGQ